MTGSDASLTPTPLLEKLSLVTQHHLLTRIPDKLDLDNWNYSSWEYFFEQLCKSYDVATYLRTPSTDLSTSSLVPLTPEQTKVDKIVLSWLLFTLSDSLHARLIDSIVTILTILDARVNEEDLVHYVIEGLPETYNSVCGYMHWKDSFLDLKTFRSLLITEEMRLKSKSLALPVDSSFLIVLMAESNPIPHSSTTQGMNLAMPNTSTNVNLPPTATVPPIVRGPNVTSSTATSPHAYYASPGTYLGPTITPPHGFHTPAQAHVPYYFTTYSNQAHLIPSTAGPAPNVMGQVNIVSPATQPTSPLAMGLVPPAGTTNISGHAMLLPWAFTTGTLHDPTTGAWNMDTGAISHLNNYVTSLSTILNSCMYSTISIGDGHSILVTNTGHSILSTPLKSLRLNNVLITLHIDFMTRRVLLRCDNTGDLYPVTAPSPIPS
ncbi:hypothetical protein Tco_0570632, partial [Tanacetum coccineum]